MGCRGLRAIHTPKHLDLYTFVWGVGGVGMFLGTGPQSTIINTNLNCSLAWAEQAIARTGCRGGLRPQSTLYIPYKFELQLGVGRIGMFFRRSEDFPRSLHFTPTYIV